MMTTTKTLGLSFLLLGIFSIGGPYQQIAENEVGTGVRVGVFDSRAVAVAWARSDMFAEMLREAREEHEQALEAGDETRIAEIEAHMRARQDELHKQGFGTWPVTDLLDHIRGEIPAIAAVGKVDVIVSKWDVVYREPDAVLVDVTQLMIEPFDPSNKSLEIIAELMLEDPLSLEELQSYQDH